MCSGLIHHLLPDDIELSGIIAKLDTGHAFFMGNDLDRLEKNLEISGAVVAKRFRGLKPALISTIKSLNEDHGLPGYNPLAKLAEMQAT